MSLRRLFRRVEQAVRPVVKAAAPVLSVLPGAGPVVSTVRTAAQLASAARAARPAAQSMPSPLAYEQAVASVSPLGGPMSIALPALPAIGGAIATGARMIGRGARRYGPAAVGAAGTAAVLYDAAGRPVQAVRRKTRSRGITARELKSFTRVTSILNKYCKTPPPMKRRTSRSKGCR